MKLHILVIACIFYESSLKLCRTNSVPHKMSTTYYHLVHKWNTGRTWGYTMVWGSEINFNYLIYFWITSWRSERKSLPCFKFLADIHEKSVVWIISKQQPQKLTSLKFRLRNQTIDKEDTFTWKTFPVAIYKRWEDTNSVVLKMLL